MAGTKAPKLPVQEAVLVWISLLNLLFLPWALGTMHVWSQLVSLALSTVGFVVALLPRRGLAPPDRPFDRLVRFPIFWAGLAVLTYIAIQGLNPALKFLTDSKAWWLVPLDHNSLLPSGVDAPYGRSNPWRAMAMFGSSWALTCSIWSGFLRRLSYRLTFSAIAFGGALLAVLGLAQQISGTNRIFWAYSVPEKANFMASFIYRNHAGAYFNLTVAVASGLAIWHGRRARRKLEGPAAAVAFGFVAALIGTAVIFSASRMSIVLLAAFTLMAALGPALHAILERQRQGTRRLWFAMAFPAVCVLAIGFVSFKANDVWKRFAELVASPTATLQYRSLAREAAVDMLRDRWILGWGAGCFRYGFPIYAQHYPEIYLSLSGRLKYWEHVHDDLLEFPIELGAVGMIPVVLSLLYAGWRLLGARFWRTPFSLCAASGCLLTLVHAWVDFVFQNPAIMTTWACLLVGAVRWAELESKLEQKRLNVL